MNAPTGKPAAKARDHRVDFYRGIALLMIFVNHVPGVAYEHFTSRNFGFSDSAEVFVFLAGFASAYAYGRPFLQGAPLIASIRALRRALVLYLVHIALTMAVVALFVWAAMSYGDGALMRQIGLGHLLTQPMDTLFGIATLGHQLGYVNILPMYSALLLLLPAMLIVLRLYGPNGLLIASVALWILAGVFRINVPNYPNPGGWFFNPLAWQVIFAAGLYCGVWKARGVAAVPFSAPLYAAAILYLVFAFVFVRLDLWGAQAALPFPFLVQEFDKTFVTLPRLLHLFAVVYVFAYAPASSPLSRIKRDNPLAMLGRHSLPVFALGTFLSMVAQVLRFGQQPTLLFDTVLIGGGLALHFALAYYLDWWRKVSKAPIQAVPAASPAPAAAAPEPPIKETAGKVPQPVSPH